MIYVSKEIIWYCSKQKNKLGVLVVKNKMIN